MAVTFKKLVKAEPRLGALYKRAKETPPTVCPVEVWYGYRGHAGLKPVFVGLVGWARKPDPLLGTMDAYSTAYETIYNALPNCGPQCLHD